MIDDLENEIARRSARVWPPIPITARLRLFGAKDEFEFDVVNLSETGLLVRGTEGLTYHFNRFTLFEVSLIETASGIFVHCIAKFVRMHDESSMAVTITDVDDQNAGNFKDLIRRLGDVGTPAST